MSRKRTSLQWCTSCILELDLQSYQDQTAIKRRRLYKRGSRPEHTEEAEGGNQVNGGIVGIVVGGVSNCQHSTTAQPIIIHVHPTSDRLQGIVYRIESCGSVSDKQPEHFGLRRNSSFRTPAHERSNNKR